MRRFQYINYLLMTFILCLNSSLLLANDQASSNIKTLAKGQISPKAQIDSVGWIAGYWQGEIWDGRFEEIWSEPSAGSMMASFKYMEGDNIGFYEIITIVEESDSLMIRLKHFSADLTGWEKEDETVDFKLVDVQPDAVYFDGYTFKHISDNEMHVYVIVDSDGKSEEVKFTFKRKN